MTNQNIPEKGKIQWLAILQGLCMVMVVIDHIRLCQGEIMPWSAALNNVIESYAMELFMFISGWLFYHTCIRKEKPYKEVLRSFLRFYCGGHTGQAAAAFPHAQTGRCRGADQDVHPVPVEPAEGDVVYQHAA